MQKLLVIGASSFSGQHFCRFAEAKGFDVWRGNLRTWNFPMSSEFTHVVNFAALNVVAPSWHHAAAYMRVNAEKQILVWEYLLAAGMEKYVHISTPEVYGSTVGQVTEETPFNPSTPYAVSRAAAEMMARCYHKQYQFPVVFTRACNVYGPGQQMYRMIPKLIASIKKGIKFPLEGSGMSSRAFIHIDDLCAAIWRVLEDGEPPLAYHISSQHMFRIRDLVSIVCGRMGVKLADVVRYVDERPGKDASYHLDIRCIRALGWYDKITIEDGIDQTIRWLNNNWMTLQNEPMEYEIQL